MAGEKINSGAPRGRNKGMLASGKPKDTKKTIKRLASYLKRYKLRLVLVLFCVIVTSLSSLAGSYMLRPIINGLTSGEGSVAFLARSVFIMLLIYAAGILSQYFQARIMVDISQGALQQLRNDLFCKIQRLPVRFFDTNAHGDVMSRFTNDVDAVGEVLNQTLVQIISGVISIVGTFSLMLYTNVYLTLVTIVMLPLMMLAGQAVAKRSRKYYQAQQDALGRLNGYIEETVTGQKVVKVFCHEEQAIADFEKHNRELREKQLGAQFFGGIMGPVMGNLSQVNYTLTAVIGGILCVAKGFDIGGLTVFVNYSRQFSRPINELSMQMNIIFSALAGAERVFHIMDEAEEPENAKAALRIEEADGSWEWCIPQENTAYAYKKEEPRFHAEVVLQDVSFGYLPDKTVLKHIALYAKPGQKIAFVGSTGAGKTTITNLLNRFYDIESGCITIDGVDIKDIDRASLRKNVAMVLQDTHLFAGTVMENIRYGRLDATDEEVIQAAKTASAHSFIMRLEHGYDTMLEGDGANLSQGQRQLLNIARAAVSKAPILILDEATSSVDTRTEKHIERGMDRLMAERTTFVIAHRLSTVRNANAIMVLENGEIIERGDHEALLAQKGRYYQLYTGLSELE